MEFVYYLVKNQEIVEKFLENNKHAIKAAFKTCCDNSEEIDEIKVYKVPFDVFICDVYQLIKYGTNITIDYFDDPDGIIVL